MRDIRDGHCLRVLDLHQGVVLLPRSDGFVDAGHHVGRPGGGGGQPGRPAGGAPPSSGHDLSVSHLTGPGWASSGGIIGDFLKQIIKQSLHTWLALHLLND